MAEKGVFDKLTEGIADAIADIREKVVEEPWFGRTVTERGEPTQAQAPDWAQDQPQPSFGSSTHIIDKGPTHEQMADNANYRMVATERDANEPQWHGGRSEQDAPESSFGSSTHARDIEQARERDREKDKGIDI